MYNNIVNLTGLVFRILKSDELKDEVYEVDTDADQLDEVREFNHAAKYNTII